MKPLRKLSSKIILSVIQFYQIAISSWTPSTCRFQPTCSHYAKESVERFGPWRGSLLAIKRLARCHPFGGSGYDPVPKE